MKKGFTLIELLSVIVIFSILMIIAIPNVMSTLTNARKKTFDAQAKSIAHAAEQKYIMDSMLGVQQECYGTGELDLATIAPQVSYFVNLDDTGNVIGIKVQDPIEKFVAEGATVNGITIRTEESLNNSTPALTCNNSRSEFLRVARSIWNKAKEKYELDNSTGFACYASDEDVLGIKTNNPTVRYVVDVNEGNVTSITVFDYSKKLKATGTSYEVITIVTDDSLTEENTYRECNR